MTKMNILIVMTDQMTPFVRGCYGGRAISPSIDRLASSGTLFDACYSNSPLCAPARFAFMSGQYISRIGAWDNAAYLPSTVPTFAHYMRSLGYRTSLSGKMHFIGADQLHGFEERVTTDIYPADFGWVPDWTRPEERKDLWYHNMSSIVQAGPAAITNQLAFDDEVGAMSMRFLYDAARQKDDRPFLHVASFTHPHDPYAARHSYWDMYEDRDVGMPKLPRPPREENDPHSLRLEHVIALDAADVTEEDIYRARRAYHANVTYVDDWLGMLDQALDETGLRDNTVVLFIGDHGDMLGERGLWYKMSLYEPSARIPMILKIPGERGGRRVSAPVSQVDVLPTLIDIATRDGKTEAPELVDPTDGISLMDGNPDPDRCIAVEYTGEGAISPILMLREKQYKYVACPIDPEQLFDLDADPDEVRNLAQDPAHADVIAAFRQKADAHWDTDEITERVLDSQRRRRILSQALETGQRHSWDHQPKRDAEHEYARSHMDLANFEHWSRWPRPPEFHPKWR